MRCKGRLPMNCSARTTLEFTVRRARPSPSMAIADALSATWLRTSTRRALASLNRAVTPRAFSTITAATFPSRSAVRVKTLSWGRGSGGVPFGSSTGPELGSRAGWDSGVIGLPMLCLRTGLFTLCPSWMSNLSAAFEGRLALKRTQSLSDMERASPFFVGVQWPATQEADSLLKAGQGRKRSINTGKMAIRRGALAADANPAAGEVLNGGYDALRRNVIFLQGSTRINHRRRATS